MLRPYGEIHVSHKMGQPYNRWNLELLAAKVSLVMFEKVCFQKDDYLGYNNKRGSGSRCDESFPLGRCCTFKFQIGDLKKLKKPNQKRAGPVSLTGGHKARAENLTNNMRPSHLPLLVLAWPLPHFRPVANTALQHCLVAQRQQPGFSLNFNGAARPLYSNHQGTIQPVLGMSEPYLNALPATGGIPPAIGCITHPHLLAPQEVPFYMQRSIAGRPGRDSCLYFDRRLLLQREHEMQRQAVMPVSTGLIYSSVLDDDRREYVPPGRVNYSYCDNRLYLQREHEMHRQATMPGAIGLIYSSAFLEDRRREYIQKQESLCWKTIGTR